MSDKQSPIFSKTYDFILWLINHTEAFPKSERFRLARRLEDAAFDFYELLIRAVRSSSKRHQLLEADLELDTLRIYIRLCYSRNLLKPNQYQYAAECMQEIGNLLGGWLKVQPPIHS